VLLGAPGLTGNELISLQTEHLLAARDVPADTIDEQRARQQRLLDIYTSEADSAAAARNAG
jgi:hypothetical protein